jgi:hypothetical protein
MKQLRKGLLVLVIIAWALTLPLNNFLGNYAAYAEDFDLPLFMASILAGRDRLQVLDPYGGETLTAGSRYTISWRGPDRIKKIDIQLSMDGGDTYPITIASATTNSVDDQQYRWDPVPFHDPLKLSSKCKIRLVDSANLDRVLDESDGVFIIGPAAITMTEEILHGMNEDLMNDPDHKDSDGDGLSDNVEIYLGTDPFHWDTDRDGYADIHEVFHELPNSLPIADGDRDGTIKALDNDDDGKPGDNDGWFKDFDEDGIPDFLEIYGFVYNLGELELWDGSIDAEYFKTNPNKTSTDRDPYSDYQEAVDGPGMDDFVKHPGDHPNVATIPNIVITPNIVDGKWWDVTLNETITTTEGTSVGKGTNWSEDTYNLTAKTDEYHWEATQEVNYSILDIGGSTNLSYGESHSTTKTTGTVRSEGGEILNTKEWSTATSTNPLEAASITFYLKATNVGTCPVQDPKLNVNLLIGGKLVLTFTTPEDMPTIAAGEDYTFALNLSALPTPRFLTLNELRLLDTGAPLAFQIYEILEGTVLGTGEDRWDYYQLNAEEVCARMFLDLGDGNTTEHLVYAGTGEKFNEPKVTLQDALIWAANAQLIEVQPGVWRPYIQFYQPGGGLGNLEPLDDWYFKLDEGTYRSIESYIQNSDFNLFDTVLTSDSVVVAKAPPIEKTPRIHWAELSPRDGTVKAYADDYFLGKSLLEVYFIDKNRVRYEMIWDDLNGYYCSDRIPKDYFKNGTEKIVARNPMFKDTTPGPCPWDEVIDPCPWETEFQASEMGYIPGFKIGYLVGSVDTPGMANGVFVKDNYAYVADWDRGLRVIDVNPKSSDYLKEVGFIEDKLVGRERKIMVTEKGELTIAYLANAREADTDSGSGLRVINVTDPTKPVKIGEWDSPGHGTDVFVSGGYAYMTDHTWGLHVLDISNHTINPEFKGTCCMYKANYSVAVVGSYAYLADYNGLRVIDVSIPTVPTPLENSEVTTSGSALGIFVTKDPKSGSPKYAYVADGDSGLQVIDVSDPTHPDWKSSCPTEDHANEVFVSGNYAYVADRFSGLQVIDVSDPIAPKIVGSVDTPGYAEDVFVSGDFVYVADWHKGLQVIGFK